MLNRFNIGDRVIVKGTDDDEESPEMIVEDYTFVDGIDEYLCNSPSFDDGEGEWIFGEDLDLVAQ